MASDLCLSLTYRITDGKLVIGLVETDDQGDIDQGSIEIPIKDLLAAVEDDTPDDGGRSK